MIDRIRALYRPLAVEEWVGIGVVAAGLALWLVPVALAWVGVWLILDANRRAGGA